MRHRSKNGDWSERRRIYVHPLLGKRFHHILLGFGRITRMWSQHNYTAHVEPHESTHTVIEYTTDTGMRFIDYYWRLGPDMVDEDGALLKDSNLWDGFDGYAPAGIFAPLAKRLKRWWANEQNGSRHIRALAYAATHGGRWLH